MIVVPEHLLTEAKLDNLRLVAAIAAALDALRQNRSAEARGILTAEIKKRSKLMMAGV